MKIIEKSCVQMIAYGMHHILKSLPNKGNTPDRYAPGDFVVSVIK